MPPVFPGAKANTIDELAVKLGLSPASVKQTVDEFNAACVSGTFDHSVLDDCHTRGLTPVKSHWASPIIQRSEEHTSELQSLMRISYAVFCLKKNNTSYILFFFF